MSRRGLDIIASGLGLVLLAFPLSFILFLVWRQDGHSPFYVADRAGVGGRPFKMVKIRSLVINADSSGVESTSASDSRITPLGHFIRRWKIDELSQLWNVLKGDMSLVGPRPNTMGEIATYSHVEMGLLSVRPGITDFSSIVFSDEAEILRDRANPDKTYGEIIRPWKSRLGLVYVDNVGMMLNLRLIWLTIVAIVNKERALEGVQVILQRLRVDAAVAHTARREGPLKAAPLP